MPTYELDFYNYLSKEINIDYTELGKKIYANLLSERFGPFFLEPYDSEKTQKAVQEELDV